MAATREEIAMWFDRGVANGDTYMVVWTDEYDWVDYPEYFNSADKAREALHSRSAMQRATEVYDLSADPVKQLDDTFCWALED